MNCVIKGVIIRFFRWVDSFNPTIESKICPIWVHFPGIPLFLLDEEALLSIGSAIGSPLFIDPRNLDHKKVGYARIFIALDVSFKYPEAILIEFKHKDCVSEKLVQKVVYDNIPRYCSGCMHVGHDLVDCKVGSNTLRRDVKETNSVDKVLGMVPTGKNSDLAVDTYSDRVHKVDLVSVTVEAKELNLEEVIVEDCSSEEGEFRPSKNFPDGSVVGLKSDGSMDKSYVPSAHSKALSVFVKPAALASTAGSDGDVVHINADSPVLQADDRAQKLQLSQTIDGKGSSDKHIQYFIHLCKAVHLGRNMLEAAPSSGNPNLIANIEDSAIPYVQKLIKTKVIEEWSTKLKEISSAFVLPSPHHNVQGSATVGKDLVTCKSFGPLEGLMGKDKWVVDLAHATAPSSENFTMEVDLQSKQRASVSGEPTSVDVNKQGE